MSARIFRFAPSPNGYLHLGHALSALINRRLADEADGLLLLRIDDIDLDRARPEFERAIIEDLGWLGIRFDGGIRRQSDHLDDYTAALEALSGEALVYPAFMSRGDIRRHIADAEASGRQWPRDPDGAPLYPGIDKHLDEVERRRRIDAGAPFAWRLDIDKAAQLAGAALCWREDGSGPNGESGRVSVDPKRWGDVVLARRDAPASYHLSVVVDDAIQNVTDIVRGRDLFYSTGLHRLLQELLGLPVPHYHHHRLVLGDDGRKLSKSRQDTGIAALRAAGMTPADVIRLAGTD